MDDDPLAPLVANLARAKLIEAAALLDVRDRRADEAGATTKRQRAERDAKYAAERVENCKLAIQLRCDAMADSELEPELDPKLITGPEQEKR